MKIIPLTILESTNADVEKMRSKAAQRKAWNEQEKQKYNASIAQSQQNAANTRAQGWGGRMMNMWNTYQKQGLGAVANQAANNIGNVYNGARSAVQAGWGAYNAPQQPNAQQGQQQGGGLIPKVWNAAANAYTNTYAQQQKASDANTAHNAYVQQQQQAGTANAPHRFERYQDDLQKSQQQNKGK